MGQFLVGLVAFVLGATYLLAPLFSREATWQTGGACSPTIFAVSAATVGIWQMAEALAMDAEGVMTWAMIIGLIIALLLGERGWRRRRTARPQDIMRRGGGGPSLDDVSRARFEEKRRKEKEEAERIVREEEGSREEPQEPARPGSVPLVNQADIYQEIRRLAELRDEGLLTPDEFEAKKRELLDRL